MHGLSPWFFDLSGDLSWLHAPPVQSEILMRAINARRPGIRGNPREGPLGRGGDAAVGIGHGLDLLGPSPSVIWLHDLLRLSVERLQLGGFLFGRRMPLARTRAIWSMTRLSWRLQLLDHLARVIVVVFGRSSVSSASGVAYLLGAGAVDADLAVGRDVVTRWIAVPWRSLASLLAWIFCAHRSARLPMREVPLMESMAMIALPE
jgi:hypothetical protein